MTRELEEHEWCVDGPGLSSIISCCPSLTGLDVGKALSPNADTSLLLRLPRSCVSLGLGGEGANMDDACAAVVAQLTQLTKLDWIGSDLLTDRGLESLTSLTNLGDLMMFECQSISSNVCRAMTGNPDDFFLEFNDNKVGGRVVAVLG